MEEKCEDEGVNKAAEEEEEGEEEEAGDNFKPESLYIPVELYSDSDDRSDDAAYCDRIALQRLAAIEARKTSSHNLLAHDCTLLASRSDLARGNAEDLLHHGEPFVDQGPTFPAWEQWADEGQLLARFGEVPVRVDCVQESLELRLSDFFSYAVTTEADAPFAVANSSWEGPRSAMRADLAAPRVASENLFDVFPDHAPPESELTLHVGGHRTGALPRTYPDGATGWHTIICGSQLWALIPPGVDILHSDESPLAWFLHDRNARQATLSSGDTVFIPPGWSFAYVTLPGPPCVAIAQATLLRAAFQFSVPILEKRRPRFLRRLSAMCGLACVPSSPVTHSRPTRLEGSCGYGVQCVHFSDMSVAAFRRGTLDWKEPRIITGLAPYIAAQESFGFGLEFLRDVLHPDLVAPVKVCGDTVPEMSLGDFFGLLDRGEDVYLADISIADYFPWLFKHLKLPRYFLHCFAHRTRRSHRWGRNKTPALFVGAKGTTTPLHIDQLESNFFMFLAEGRKEWVCFHPEEADQLPHEWDEAEQIRRFRPLRTGGAKGGARRVDFVLEEGEVLYIPRGTPHEVRNLTQSVAVSANYWDQSNVAPALRLLEAKIAQLDSRSARHKNLDTLRAALDEIEWPSVEEELQRQDEATLPGEEMVGLHRCHEDLSDVRPSRFRRA